MFYTGALTTELLSGQGQRILSSEEMSLVQVMRLMMSTCLPTAETNN